MDVKVIETGNGGDLTKNGNDLAMVFSFENMVYLALFGGNKAAVTPQKRISSEQAFDYWANSLLFPEDTGLQFNSITEKTLETTALTSVGRLTIEDAVKSDLEFMAAFAEVSVSSQIVSSDRIDILYPGTYYLEKVDKNWRRFYARKEAIVVKIELSKPKLIPIDSQK